MTTTRDGIPAVEYEQIPRVAAPSPEIFHRDFVVPGRPVVLTGLIDSWPARRLWSLDYFSRNHGEASLIGLATKEGRVAISENEDADFSDVRLDEFTATLLAGNTPTRYVTSALSRLPAGLREDFSLPPYCAESRWLWPKFWLGARGTVTPLHWDLPHNLSAQVFGVKRWLLYPRNQWRLLYPCRPWSRAPNFSQLNPEAPDLVRFPRFARARPLGVILQPGETLYIPAFWWHQVRSLEDNAALSFWFGGRAIAAAGMVVKAFKRVASLYKNEWA